MNRPGFIALSQYRVSQELPLSSNVFVHRFPTRNILVRPHSPEGLKHIAGMDQSLPIEQRTIYFEKNRKWPKIWGWILAVHEDDLALDPELRPGAMIVFKRFADELLAHDTPHKTLWLGHTLPISLVHIDSIDAVIDPPPVPVDY